MNRTAAGPAARPAPIPLLSFLASPLDPPATHGLIQGGGLCSATGRTNAPGREPRWADPSLQRAPPGFRVPGSSLRPCRRFLSLPRSCRQSVLWGGQTAAGNRARRLRAPLRVRQLADSGTPHTAGPVPHRPAPAPAPATPPARGDRGHRSGFRIRTRSVPCNVSKRLRLAGTAA
jgi:hypothetical protein